MTDLAIYMHIPFCTTKCSYCAFNTYTSLESLIPDYVDALATEIEVCDPEIIRLHQVHTVYFGGGTPSILNISQIEKLISTIYNIFHVYHDVEITIEANPDDLIEISWLHELIDIGVGRLSIGMQSAVGSELKLFNRRHDFNTAQNAVQHAREAGFNNINLDLIFGFPGQTLLTWEQSLKGLINLQPEHISLYALGLEPGTDLDNWVRRGQHLMPDNDLVAEMYEYASAFMDDAGYTQYEISNWAKPGYECQHNLQYWHNEPYLGFGAGAHGYINKVRYEVIRNPKHYVDKLFAQRASSVSESQMPPAIYRKTNIGREDEIAETLITGLRLLNEGLNRDKFKKRFGIDVMEIHGATFEKYQDLSIVEIGAESIRLTSKGRLVNNAIFRELI